MQRRMIAFIVAAGAMVVLGAAAQSYFVQEAWSMAAGLADGSGAVAIPLIDRVSWCVHDLRGIFVQYGGTTSLALLIALLVAGAVVRRTGHRSVVFGLAGAAAMLTMFTALRMLLGTVGIFGARGPVGLAAQMAVGLIAGLIFAYLTPPRVSRPSRTPG
jgi:hypothetical protein